MAEDVVPDDLGTDYSTHNLSSVNANTHIQVLKSWIFCLGALLSDNVDHLETNLDDPEGFLNLNNCGPFFLADFTRVAQDDVAVSNRVDFVNSDLLA